MRGLFGSPSAPTPPALLASSSGQHKTSRQRRVESARQAAAAEQERSKRREFTFMKYAQQERRSATSMNKAREHARQLAMAVSTDDDDFGFAAFGTTPAKSKASTSMFPPAFEANFPGDGGSGTSGGFGGSSAGEDVFDPFNTNNIGTSSHGQSRSNSRSFKSRDNGIGNSSQPFRAQPRQPQHHRNQQSSSEQFPPPSSSFGAQSSHSNRSSRGSSGSNSYGNGVYKQNPAMTPPKSDSRRKKAMNVERQLPTTPERTSTNSKGKSRVDPSESFETASFGSGFDPPFLPVQPQASWTSTGTGATSSSRTPSSAQRIRRKKSGSLDEFVERQAQQRQTSKLQQQQRSQSKTGASWGEVNHKNIVSGSSATSRGKSSAERSVISMPSASAAASSGSTGGTSSAGAAARRRMRSQMKRLSTSSQNSGDSMSTPPPAESPPSSTRRYDSSANSVGSASQKNRNSLMQYYNGSSNSSVGGSSVGRPKIVSGNSFCSQASSVSGTDANIFDTDTKDGGFTFDAFGLDASQMEREVNEAMQDLGFSMFFDPQDSSTATSDSTPVPSAPSSMNQYSSTFAKAQQPSSASPFRSTPTESNQSQRSSNRLSTSFNDDFDQLNWDSPNNSRSSPIPSDSGAEGFVDGFRVTKSVSAHHSPPSEKSTLTTSSMADRFSNSTAPNGRVNMFKEQAGFGGARRIQPAPTTESELSHNAPVVSKLSGARTDAIRKAQSRDNNGYIRTPPQVQRPLAKSSAQWGGGEPASASWGHNFRSAGQGQKTNNRNSMPAISAPDALSRHVNPWKEDPWNSGPESDAGSGGFSDIGTEIRSDAGDSFTHPNPSHIKSDSGVGIKASRLSTATNGTNGAVDFGINPPSPVSDGASDDSSRSDLSEFRQDLVQQFSEEEAHSEIQSSTAVASTTVSSRLLNSVAKKVLNNYGADAELIRTPDRWSSSQSRTSAQHEKGQPIGKAIQPRTTYSDDAEASLAPKSEPGTSRPFGRVKFTDRPRSPPKRQKSSGSVGPSGFGFPRDLVETSPVRVEQPASILRSKDSSVSMPDVDLHRTRPTAIAIENAQQVASSYQSSLRKKTISPDKSDNLRTAFATNFNAVDSDVGVSSDVNVASDAGVNLEFPDDENPTEQSGDKQSVPTEVTSKEKVRSASILDGEVPEEEKKEEETETPTRPVPGKLRNLKAQWRQWESKSKAPPSEVKPYKPVQRPKKPSFDSSSISKLESSLGHEMLTPDIIEARRKAARMNRIEQLKRKSMDALNRSTPSQYNPSVIVETEVDDSDGTCEPDDTVTTKSEGGAGIRGSAADRVLDRIRRQSPRYREIEERQFKQSFGEARSDVGSAPSFLSGVKLRKTPKPASTDPVNQAEANHTDEPSKAEADETAEPDYEIHSEPEPVENEHSEEDEDVNEPKIAAKPLTYRERRELERQVQREEEIARLAAEEAENTRRKLTYREKRELELRKQKELEEQEKKAPSPPKRDVASLIRQRIAANKQKNEAIAAARSEQEPQATVSQYRSLLKPVKVEPESEPESELDFDSDLEPVPHEDREAEPEFKVDETATSSAISSITSSCQRSPHRPAIENEQRFFTASSTGGHSVRSRDSPPKSPIRQSSLPLTHASPGQQTASVASKLPNSPSRPNHTLEPSASTGSNAASKVLNQLLMSRSDLSQSTIGSQRGSLRSERCNKRMENEVAELNYSTDYDDTSVSIRGTSISNSIDKESAVSHKNDVSAGPLKENSTRLRRFVDEARSDSAGDSSSTKSYETPQTSATSLASDHHSDADDTNPADDPAAARAALNNFLGARLLGSKAATPAPVALAPIAASDPKPKESSSLARNQAKAAIGNHLAAITQRAPLSSNKPPPVEVAEEPISFSARKQQAKAAIGGHLAAIRGLGAQVREQDPQESVPSPSGPVALKDDPKYERYFRMLKVGMPMDVVKHAMTKDGLDPSIMDGDHNQPVGLPLKQDPKYAKYFKMLKIGVSIDQVKHSMTKDGLDPEILDQDHNLPVDLTSLKKRKEPKEKDTHRRARLHWKTLQDVRSNSVWAKLGEDPAMSQIDIDEEEFKELFQADFTPVISPKGFGANRVRGAAVRVIDSKRANNGGIILAHLKMTHDEMADAVDRIDSSSLSSEQIEHIIQFLPTKEERGQLEAYMLQGGEDPAEKFDGLCECEKFMVSMMTVRHAKRKVRALLFKLQFMSCLESIAEDTTTIEAACDELNGSTRLRKLLGIVLQFGNRLNTAGGSSKRKAGAFTLDSLLKLNQAKAFDKKTTFLHYVVLIVQRNDTDLLTFQEDITTVRKADRIYWDQCLADLQEVENQLENVRRISLHHARHTPETSKPSSKDDDNESLGDMDLSLEEEVEALRATSIGLFTLSAIKQVAAIRDKVELTKSKFDKLLEYFGEDNKKMQPHELFHIFATFGRDFRKASEEVASKARKKQREDRKKSRGTPNGKPPAGPDRSLPKTPSLKTPSLRASSMQPNMSKVIRDLHRSPPPQHTKTDSRAVPHQIPPSSPRIQNDHHASDARANVQAAHHPVSKSSPGPEEVIEDKHEQKPTSPAPLHIETEAPSSQQQEVRNQPTKTQSSSHEDASDTPTTPVGVVASSPRSRSRDISSSALRHKARIRRQRQMQVATGQETSTVSNITENTSSDPSTVDSIQTPGGMSPRSKYTPPRSLSDKSSPRDMIRQRRRLEAARRRLTPASPQPSGGSENVQ